MGLFSWITSDTGRSIPSTGSSRETFPVYLLSPDGHHHEQDPYEGYGVFGGVDVYVWWMRWNAPEEIEEGDTDDDIRNKFFEGSRFDDTDGGRINCKYPIKLVEDPCDYEDVEASLNCPHQGYFYEDEDEEEEEDFYEEEEEEEEEDEDFYEEDA